MSYEDISDIQAFVQIAFNAYGYSWEHPRVVAYLDKVQAKAGRFPVQARKCDCLSPEHYRGLAMCLAALVVEGREPVQDATAYALASLQVRTGQQMLVGGAV
jgi:hypothetical protein